ncbi:golgin subfamily A member 6-like protein 22 [Clinocottus analis]|uniref:golgin subfamily A member 6-like protein 22 n=1 Tax=Clinocottus analis TaxID=304258 RepID=UPI0035C1A868
MNKVTDTLIPTEEQKTKRVLRKLPFEEKEPPQKQRQLKPIKRKADDVQAKIEGKTAADARANVAEQEQAERASSLSPGIRITPEASLTAADGSEDVPSEESQKQPDRRSSVPPVMEASSSEPHVIVQTSRTAEITAKLQSSEDESLKDEVEEKETRPSVDKTGKIKVKGVQLKTGEQRDTLSPNFQLKDKLLKVSKTEEQEQRERMTEPESPQEPLQKLIKPQKVLVEQEQLTVGTVNDTTFKVSALKESTQELVDRKVSVQPLPEETSEELEVTPEEHAEIRETAAVDSFEEKPSDTLISMKRRPKLAPSKEAADKQIPSKSLTVEDKTKKVPHIEDGTPNIEEQQQRKVLDASEVDVSVPHTQHLVAQGTQKTGKEAISESEARRSKEETQKMKRLQKLPKTGDKIDEFQSVILPIKVRKEQTSLNKDKETKHEQENLLRSEAAKQSGPETRVKGKEEETEEGIWSNLIPVQSKTEEVSPTEKKTLKRRERSEITASYAAESEVTHEESNAPEQSGKTVEGIQPTRYSNEDETDKCTALEEKKTRQKESDRKEKVRPEIQVREKKLDDVAQDKDQALVKFPTIKEMEESDKVSPAMKTKPRRDKQMQSKDSVAAQRDKAPEEENAEQISSKTVVVQHEYSRTAALEGTETRQEQEDAISDTSKHITVKVQDKQEKSEGKTSVSSAAQPETTHEHTLMDKHLVTDQTTTVLQAEDMKTRQKQRTTMTAVSLVMEETKAGTVTGKDELKTTDEFEQISQKKEETKTKKPLKFDKTSLEDIQKQESPKEKSQRSGPITKSSFEEVQSKTVVVQDDYGRVTAFEAIGTKQEQVGRTASVAPVMKVVSERSLMVSEGDAETETLRRYTTPDEQIQVTGQIMPQLDLVPAQTDKVSATRENLPERYEQVKGKASVSSKREVTSLMEQEAPERLSQLEKTTTVLQAEDMKTRQKPTGTKTPGTSVTDTEIKDIESMKSKPLKEESQRSDRVQSKTVTVRHEYGSVAPIHVLEAKQEQVGRTASVAPVMEVASERAFLVKEEDAETETLRREHAMHR